MEYKIISMRRFLPLLIGVIVTPLASQAVDYLQCEAIDKAYRKAWGRQSNAEFDAGYAAIMQLEVKYCGPNPLRTAETLASGKWNAYKKCIEDLTSATWYKQKYQNLKNQDARYKAEKKNLDRIRSDLKKANCPF